MPTHLRPNSPASDLAESEVLYDTDNPAPSSPGSPPQIPQLFSNSDIPGRRLCDINFPSSDNDPEDLTFVDKSQKTTADQKAEDVLHYMKSRYGRFSLRDLLQAIFSKDASNHIKLLAGTFKRDRGTLWLMEMMFEIEGGSREVSTEAAAIVIKQAAAICAKEASAITERASRSGLSEEAKFFRVTSKQVTVDMVESFRIGELGARYERVAPHLQDVLKAVIGKEGKPEAEGSRNPDDCRTLVTSMLYNTRSRNFNYHQVMNTLVLWNYNVPKRLVQALNRMSFTSSYAYQCRAIKSISADSVRLAQAAAEDETKAKIMAYDNFNWVGNTWETSAEHSNVSHDEVSALLIVIHLPEGPDAPTAAQLADLQRFEETEGARHKIPQAEALRDIIPAAADQQEFRKNSIRHIAQILVEEEPSFAKFRDQIPPIEDPRAIPVHKTEEYYLPTFDQEQGSTRGNMIVLTHYFLVVLALSKTIFETVVFFILGDRLTTVRDRAAQDQRAVDRSPHKIDHLSCFRMLSGMMHVCMNQIQNIGKNAWGGASRDAVSLETLQSVLPNRAALKTKTIDFYAWLRFMDAVLRALVLKSAMSALALHTTAQLAEHTITDMDQFMCLCETIADNYLLPSIDRLEVEGTKTLLGPTESGHAVLLMHDLMTMREMRQSIKHGHPERMKRMLKYWMPMFYAGGSYNYSNELMETLHNSEHDWPRESANVVIDSTLVNTTGVREKFTEGDIRVEQLNDSVKAKAHGPNASPEYLESVTPAIGVIQHLAENLYEDLGVEALNQHHAKVRQHRDIQILLAHLILHNIFDFSLDKMSEHAVIDLYRHGLKRVSGRDGGHAKHLLRHLKRLRTRHGGESSGEMLDADLQRAERELQEAGDTVAATFSLADDNVDSNEDEGEELE